MYIAIDYSKDYTNFFFKSISESKLLEKNYYDLQTKDLLKPFSEWKNSMNEYVMTEFRKTFDEVCLKVVKQQNSALTILGLKEVLARLELQVSFEDKCVLLFLCTPDTLEELLKPITSLANSELNLTNIFNFKPIIFIEDIKFIKVDNDVTCIEINYSSSIQTEDSVYSLHDSSTCFINSGNVLSVEDRLVLINAAIEVVNKKSRELRVPSDLSVIDTFKRFNLLETDEILQLGMVDTLVDILIQYKWILMDISAGTQTDNTLYRLMSKNTTLDITMSDNEIFVSKVFSYKHSISVKVDISDKENIKENVCIY